jgi:hypothetical protein
MNCPHCNEHVRKSHRTDATPTAMTRRGECTNSKCLRVFTIVEVIVDMEPTRGNGAHGLAKKLQTGELRVELVGRDEE